MTASIGDLLLLAHALATAVMMGVIWTMQLVHYPLFARVPAGAFTAYEREHMRRISLIVGPAMLVELATATVIALSPPAGVPAVLAWAGLALLLAIWVSTAVAQGPIHRRLAARGWDQRLIDRLVASNWLRTVLWTARTILALVFLGADRPG